ncbi:MAG: hypothetical protein ACKVP4_09300 [Hyphomicrobium sp.]
MTHKFDLAPGDRIEIMYLVRRPGHECDTALFDRWVGAEIIDCDPDAWPLARLSDGQLTELRPFMTWRAIAVRGQRAVA